MRTWQAVLLFSSLSLLLLLALGTNSAQASPNLQGTATPTFQPLYATSTPLAEHDLTCPTALPGGWGTSTPGLLWNSNCGNCIIQLTEQAYPTATPDPLATATPSPTPQGDGLWLIEVDETQNVAHSGASWDSIKFDIDANFIGNLIGMAYNISESGDCITNRMNGWIFTNTSDEDGTGQYLSLPHINSGAWGQYVGMSGYDVWVDEDAQEEFVDAIFPGYEWHQDGVKVKDGSGLHGHYFNYGYSCSGTIDITVEHLIGWGEPGETPEPTPLASTYCSVVNGVGFGGEENELGIELPEFGYGAATCAGIDEIVIPLSLLNLLTGMSFSDITIPGLEICFREISFGMLSLFGVDVDLDSVANLMAAALIIRWILRS